MELALLVYSQPLYSLYSHQTSPFHSVALSMIIDFLIAIDFFSCYQDKLQRRLGLLVNLYSYQRDKRLVFLSIHSRLYAACYINSFVLTLTLNQPITEFCVLCDVLNGGFNLMLLTVLRNSNLNKLKDNRITKLRGKQEG